MFDFHNPALAFAVGAIATLVLQRFIRFLRSEEITARDPDEEDEIDTTERR